MLTPTPRRSPEGKQFQDVNAVNSQINSPLLPYICSLLHSLLTSIACSNCLLPPQVRDSEKSHSPSLEVRTCERSEYMVGAAAAAVTRSGSDILYDYNVIVKRMI